MAKSELQKELAARLHHMISAAENSPCPADNGTCEDCLIEAGIWITRCREAAKEAIDDCAIFESYKERAKKAVDEVLR